MKKPMGRPVLPPDKKKVRLHISVDPKVAEMALENPVGISEFFNQLGKFGLAMQSDIFRSLGRPLIEVLKDQLPDENICVKDLD